MKKLLQALLIILLTATTVYAQRDRNMARIHDAKVSYIQNRLHLSGDRFRDFVPVYDQYEREIKDTRMAFFDKYKNTNVAQRDEATSRQLIDDNLDYQQAIIEIKRKYNERFLRVLTPQQLSELYRAEREFREMLMQRLNGRRVGRIGR